MVEDPSLLLQPLSKRSPWKGGENGKGGKLDIVFLDEFRCFFKDGWIISVKPEDEGAMDTDSVPLNGLDHFGQFFHMDKSFRSPIQILLEKGLKPNEERDTAAFLSLVEKGLLLCNLDSCKPHPPDPVTFKDFEKA